MEARRWVPVIATCFGLLGASAGPAVGATQPAIPGDYDGDGHVDLAIGAPGEALGSGPENAGVVHVLRGSAQGPTADGDQLWSQDSQGVKGWASGGSKSGDRFGAALASADFDRDGRADLAIGTYRDRLTPDARRTGSVNVLYGSARGLTAEGDQLWSQANLPGTPEHDDDFGRALAAADFDADGYPDLAIGVPGESLGGQTHIGAVQVLYGSPGGLDASRTVMLDRTQTGAAPDSDAIWFGFALAAGDLDGDGDADLAVGTPGGGSFSGDVGVFYGGPSGLTGGASETWNQDSPGVEDQAEDDDRFGGALVIADFDADGIGDLAVGAYAEDPTPGPCDPCDLWSAGAVNILYGSSEGLTATGNQLWHQDSPGVPGTPSQDAGFGQVMAAGDLDGDGASELAIGTSEGGGEVIVLAGSSDGLTATGVQRWTQASSGVPGRNEPGDGFGAGLAAADFGRTSRTDLAIGVPGEDGLRGRVVILFGRSTGLSASNAATWSQDAPGIRGAAERRDAFGHALAP